MNSKVSEKDDEYFNTSEKHKPKFSERNNENLNKSQEDHGQTIKSNVFSNNLYERNLQESKGTSNNQDIVNLEEDFERNIRSDDFNATGKLGSLDDDN